MADAELQTIDFIEAFLIRNRVDQNERLCPQDFLSQNVTVFFLRSNKDTFLKKNFFIAAIIGRDSLFHGIDTCDDGKGFLCRILS